MNILISWVFTLWLFLFYFQAYETLKECDWTKEDHFRIMKMCVWPLLNPQTSDKETSQQQVHYLSKTVDLFKCWIMHYTSLFFLEVSFFYKKKIYGLFSLLCVTVNVLGFRCCILDLPFDFGIQHRGSKLQRNHFECYLFFGVGNC